MFYFSVHSVYILICIFVTVCVMMLSAAQLTLVQITVDSFPGYCHVTFYEHIFIDILEYYY